MVVGRRFGEANHVNPWMPPPSRWQVDAFYDLWVGSSGRVVSALEGWEQQTERLRPLAARVFDGLRSNPPALHRPAQGPHGEMTSVETGQTILSLSTAMLRLGVKDGHVAQGPAYGPLSAPPHLCRQMAEMLDLALRDLSSEEDLWVGSD
jgi:hypothetical protein